MNSITHVSLFTYYRLVGYRLVIVGQSRENAFLKVRLQIIGTPLATQNHHPKHINTNRLPLLAYRKRISFTKK